MNNKELKRKIEFVEMLEPALQMVPGILSAQYEVYVDKDHGYVEEFVRVNYAGGGFCVRCTSANSLSAILQDIAKLANGGFYADERFYNQIKSEYTLFEG